jgi:hypothetical protein
MQLGDVRRQVHRSENSLGDVLGLDECDEAELGVALRADNLKPERFSQKLGPTDVPRCVLGLVLLDGRGGRGLGGRGNDLAT